MKMKASRKHTQCSLKFRASRFVSRSHRMACPIVARSASRSKPKRIKFDPGLGQCEYPGSVNAFLRNARRYGRVRKGKEGMGRFSRWTLEIRVSDTLWAEGVSSIHQKEQLPLLRHGFVFLQGRLTPIGYRAMPIPKVRREGSPRFPRYALVRF